MKKLLVFLLPVLLLFGCDHPEEIKLKADIRADNDSFYLVNRDDFDYVNVKFQANSIFAYKIDKIKAGETLTVSMRELSTDKGERFNKNHKLQSFYLYAESQDGDYGSISGEKK